MWYSSLARKKILTSRFSPKHRSSGQHFFFSKKKSFYAKRWNYFHLRHRSSGRHLLKISFMLKDETQLKFKEFKVCSLPWGEMEFEFWHIFSWNFTELLLATCSYHNHWIFGGESGFQCLLVFVPVWFCPPNFGLNLWSILSSRSLAQWSDWPRDLD